MQRFFFASACAAVLAFSVAPPPALAYLVSITVKNDSTSCAWITIYESAGFLPWMIAKGRARPRFVRPGTKFTFDTLSNPMQVKVRAEVKQNPNCSGQNIADISDYRKDVNEQEGLRYATLSNPHGRYTLSIH